MLIMTLRWDVVDVENVIVMMYIMYVHGGVVTKLDIVGPCGLNNLKRDRLRMQKKQQQSI